MRVLFVDDNQDVRDAVGALLQEEGLDVHACASAEEAEAVFAAGGLDFLLTDVSLPAKSGVALARAVLQRAPAMWIVFLSGYAMDDHLAALGPRVRCLRKPFLPEALHEIIEEIRADPA
jgi:CheY-like chemotaxis protein